MDKEALLELSKKISGNRTNVVSDVQLALDNPLKYIEKYLERLEERDITDEYEDLGWISIIDALIEEELAYEIEWEEDIERICDAVDCLLENKSFMEVDWSWVDNDNYDDTATDKFLEIIAKKLKKKALSLAYMDVDSDSYVLIIVSTAEIIGLKSLASKAGYKICDTFEKV